MKHKRNLYSFRRFLADQVNGFTLVELLIVVIIVGVLNSAMSALLSSQLYESLRFERANRETDDASRVQHLLDSEISESDVILYPGTVALPVPGDLLFALDIPTDYNIATGLPIRFRTYYFQGPAGELFRYGRPPINDPPNFPPNGSLDFRSSAADVTALISANIRFNRVSAGSNAKVLEYTLVSPSGRTLLAGKAYGEAATIR